MRLICNVTVWSRNTRCCPFVRLQRDLFMVNGCIGASNVTECEGIVNGLFRKGLHSAVQYLVLDFSKLLIARTVGAMANATTEERVGNPLWQELELVGFYVLQGLTSANGFRERAITALGSSYSQIIEAAEVRTHCPCSLRVSSGVHNLVPLLCRRFWCWVCCLRPCSCSGPRSRS